MHSSRVGRCVVRAAIPRITSRPSSVSNVVRHSNVVVPSVDSTTFRKRSSAVIVVSRSLPTCSIAHHSASNRTSTREALPKFFGSGINS